MGGSIPSDVIGGPVWMSPTVLATSRDVAICLTGITSYLHGFNIRASIRRRSTGAEGQSRPMRLDELLMPGTGLSIQVAAAGALFRPRWNDDVDAYLAPIVEYRSTSTRADIDLWIDTIPAEGVIEIGCTWPAEGIVAMKFSVDSASVRDAQSRCIRLWASGPVGSCLSVEGAGEQLRPA